MRSDELHDVLERAAAPVERPDLARAALAGAHRVRVRRRGFAAGGATVVVVTAVVVGTSLTGPRAGERPSPAPAPTRVPTTQAEAIPDDVVQDFWNVKAVGQLPLRVSTLPETVEQPARAPALRDAPIPAAVLSLWGEGDVIHLLSPEGEWRSVPHPGPEPWLAPLSGDGTRLAMPGPSGLEVWDLAAGTSAALPWPDDARLPVTDLVSVVQWMPDGEQVLVVSGSRSWLMGEDGGVQELPLPTNRYNSEVFPADDGRVVELAYSTRGVGRSILEWEGPVQASSRDTTPLEAVQRGVVRGDLLAAVRGDGGWSSPRLTSDWDGLIVLSRTDLQARAYLPIRDDNAAYTDNGNLVVHGWLDDETVLAWVRPEAGNRLIGEEWWLVAWHYPSGEVTRLAGGNADARPTDVVPSLLTP